MALFQIGFLQVLDASWCLFYAVLCMHALDFGVNWDEGLQTDLGLCTWRQLTSGTNTLEQLRRSQWDIGLFPPLVELLLVAPAVALGAPLLSCRRFGMAMISFIGLLALRRFGASLQLQPQQHQLVPPLAVIALLGMPRYAGHALCNSKDAAFAAAFVCAMVPVASFVAAVTSALPSSVLFKRAVEAGLAIGLVLCVRVQAALLLVLAMCSAAILWARCPRRSSPQPPRPQCLALVWRATACVLFLIASLFPPLLLWPALGASPSVLLHTLLVNMLSRTYGTDEGIVSNVAALYNGVEMESQRLPWHYAFRVIGITTPLPTLALAALGLLVLLRTTIDELFTADARTQAKAFAHATRILLLLWLVAPTAVVLILQPNLYDGLRHLLFLLPALALLAAIGAASLLQQLVQSDKDYTTGAVAKGQAKTGVNKGARVPMVTALLWSALPAMVSLHPYQYCYFNEIVGGVASVSGQPNGINSIHCTDLARPTSVLPERCARFDTEYYVSSYAEAARWVMRDAGIRAGVSSNTTVTVAVAANRLSADAFSHAVPRSRVRVLLAYSPASDPRRDSFTAEMPADVQYFVSTPRFGLDTLFPGEPIVARVSRAGAVFAIVKKNTSALRRLRAEAEASQCTRLLRVLYDMLGKLERAASAPTLCASVYSGAAGREQLLSVLRRAGLPQMNSLLEKDVLNADLEDIMVRNVARQRRNTQSISTTDRRTRQRSSSLHLGSHSHLLTPQPDQGWRNIPCGAHDKQWLH